MRGPEVRNMATTMSIVYESALAVPGGTLERIVPSIGATPPSRAVVIEPYAFGGRNINQARLRNAMPQFTVEPAEVLKKYKVIAVVGASKSPEKDAYTVPEFMKSRGYTIIPVNPTAESIHGVKAYPNLDAIPDQLAKTVEVVDVFRPSEEFPEVAKNVAAMKKKTGRPFVFWGQLHLENEDAKKILEDAKIDYVMDRCMRIEQRMLTGQF